MGISILSLTFISGRLFSLEPVTLTENMDKYPIGHHLEYLEDKDTKWTIKDVLSAQFSKDFVKSKVKTLTFGFTRSAYWLRFRIKNPLNKEYHWYLEVNNPRIDKIKLFIPKKNKQYDVRIAGDNYPFSVRNIKHRNTVYPLTLAPFEDKTYYMRFDSGGSIIVPLLMWSPIKFLDTTVYEYTALGFFYGILFVILLYNLFLYFSIQDKSYLYYVIYIFWLMMFYLAYDGITSQYLPFELSVWISNHGSFIVFLTFVWALQFTRVFLKIKEKELSLYRIIMILSYLGVSGSLISLFTENDLAIQSSVIFGIFTVCAVIAAGFIRHKKRYKPAKYFLIAWLTFIIGVFVLGLKAIGLLPDNIFTNHTIKLGSVLEVILLSLALGYRINIMKKSKDKARTRARASLKKVHQLKDEFVHTVKSQVEERTKEFKKLIQAVEYSPVSVIITDRIGKIEYVNSKSTEISGYTLDDLIGKTPRYMQSGRHNTEFYKNLWDTLIAGKTWYGEFYNKKKNGELFWEKASIAPIKNEKGKISHYVAVKEDITERKRVERLREDTELIIKHDLKNPLNGILGYSQFLMEKSLSENKIYEFAISIYNSANQILHMINNSLDLFKMEEGTYRMTKEEVNLVQVFERLNKEFIPLQKRKSLSLVYKLNDKVLLWNESYLVTGEKVHLTSLFSNLMKNALEASPENNEINISMNNYKEPFEILIHNFGVIPESIRKRFFDRYATSGKSGGTGIGTYSAYLIAKSHGGDITFQSSEKEGTYLKVILPKYTD